MWYDKSNEGYMYNDQTRSSKKYDDAVYPGSQYTYEWFLPEEISPTDQDPPCIARLYSSTVDPVKDVYSGNLSTNNYKNQQFMFNMMEGFLSLSNTQDSTS